SAHGHASGRPVHWDTRDRAPGPRAEGRVQRALSRRIGAAVVALLALVGCSDNAVKGGLIGAAGGGLVGAVTSGRHTGRNLALGAVIGGLVGALTGEVVTQKQAVAAATNPPPPPGPPGPPPPGPVTPP